ncbi:hypothetical protein JCM3765_004666 [Sporobolomyces pararoseus]
MEEAERFHRQRQQSQWHEDQPQQQQQAEVNQSSNSSSNYSSFPSHSGYQPPPPPWNPPPIPQQHPYHQSRVRQQFRLLPPPHPDDFPPHHQHHHPQLFESYPYHEPSNTSPDISPLTQTSYPLYPPPPGPPPPSHQIYSQPSPVSSINENSSTPSPFTTPGGSVLPLPPPAQNNPTYGPDLSHMYGAVESARWMATMDQGGGIEEIPQFSSSQSQQHHYNKPPPPHPPSTSSSSSYNAYHSHSHYDESIGGPPYGFEDDSDRRRPSDSSIASNDSSSVFNYARLDGFTGIDDPSLGGGTIGGGGGGGSGGSGSGGAVKPFIDKLFGILSRPAIYGDVLKWNDSGDSFFVAHSDKFIKEVLPEQFCHSNIHSFTRQLNVYNFTRMSVKQLRQGLSIPSATTSEYSGWSHPLFKRGDTTTLSSLNPRPSRARMLKKLEKQYGATTTTAGTTSMTGSLNYQHHHHATGMVSASGSNTGIDQRRVSNSSSNSNKSGSTSEKRKSMASIDEYG